MVDLPEELLSCPACNSIQVYEVVTRAAVTTLRCNLCALEFAFLEDAPGPDKAIDTDPDFFHGLTDSFNVQLAKAHAILPKRLDAYAELLGRPIKSVLEVGCATGAYARAFDSLGIRYRAIEIDQEMARQAQTNTGLDIVHGNFMDADESESFDLFFCSQVLEHVPCLLYTSPSPRD